MNQISEIEETFNRLQNRQGVKAVLVTTLEGSVIKSSLEGEEIKEFLSNLPKLVEQSKKFISSWDKNDYIKFFSLRSNSHEFLIYPSNQKRTIFTNSYSN